jgi:hypothetical protein
LYGTYDYLTCTSAETCSTEDGGWYAIWLEREYTVGSFTAGTSNPNDINVALLAVATASSAAPGQPASAAIDGVINGYPADPEAEWSSNGGGAGSWS